MKAHSRFLQSTSSQIAEFTSYTAAIPGTRLKFKHAGQVTKHVATKEKSSYRIYEAMIVSVFLLVLFLTGCSASMTGSPRDNGGSPVFEVTGAPTVPREESSDQNEATVKPPAKETVEPSFVHRDETATRVKHVVDWLQFVRQGRAADVISHGWTRIQAGKILGDKTPETERELWREILAEEILTKTKSGEASMVQRLEILVALLTHSQSADELLRADDFFKTDAELAAN